MLCVSSQLDLCLFEFVFMCVKRLVMAILLQITPGPPAISHEQNMCFSSRAEQFA